MEKKPLSYLPLYQVFILKKLVVEKAQGRAKYDVYSLFDFEYEEDVRPLTEICKYLCEELPQLKKQIPFSVSQFVNEVIEKIEENKQKTSITLRSTCGSVLADEQFVKIIDSESHKRYSDALKNLKVYICLDDNKAKEITHWLDNYIDAYINDDLIPNQKNLTPYVSFNLSVRFISDSLKSTSQQQGKTKNLVTRLSHFQPNMDAVGKLGAEFRVLDTLLGLEKCKKIEIIELHSKSFLITLKPDFLNDNSLGETEKIKKEEDWLAWENLSLNLKTGEVMIGNEIKAALSPNKHLYLYLKALIKKKGEPLRHKEVTFLGGIWRKSDTIRQKVNKIKSKLSLPQSGVDIKATHKGGYYLIKR